MTRYLDLEDVTALGIALLAREGAEFLIADVGLLESALARPHATAFGKDAYPDLLHKAGALMESLARNHPLVDGNKRLAWTATVVFLLLNGANVEAPSPAQGEAFVLSVAAGQCTLDELVATLRAWTIGVPPELR